MKHPIVAGSVSAMLIAAIVGCSGSGASPGPASYLTVSKSGAAFIQWKKTPDGLRGTIEEASVGGSGPTQTLAVSSVPFTGTRKGNSVRLTFAGLYYLHPSARGTLNGGELTLTVPQPDGSASQVRLSQSGRAGYDHAVAALRARISNANRRAAEEQAGQRHQPAHALAEKNAQSALAALYQDSSLAPGSKLSLAIARLAGHVDAARSRLAREPRDASGDNKHCTAAFKVTGDELTVGGAVQAVGGDILAITPAIAMARHDMAAATAHLRQLARAGLPAPMSADGVTADATANLDHAIAATNSYIDQANAIEAHARSLADNMSAGSCSSARSGSLVHPIPPIK